ncbi:hypothetical protein [Mesoterricola sediminis]|uniref:hypothetical protein n=1 Tax=Mesoterricola sediminis TaxID=2927980 RepID=UPI002931A773|nr:hypothetical protein [Mesoterricola sediminis]
MTFPSAPAPVAPPSTPAPVTPPSPPAPVVSPSAPPPSLPPDEGPASDEAEDAEAPWVVPVAPIPEVRQAHAAALQTLDANLARNFQFESGGTWNLTEDYFQAQRALDAYKVRHLSDRGPRLNLDYLAADPYLSRHGSDINQIFPEAVSPEKWREITNALQQAAEPMDLMSLEEVMGKINMSNPETRVTVKKRVRRLYEWAKDRDEAGLGPLHLTTGSCLHEVATSLSQNNTRCIDGIQEGIGQFEAGVFGDAFAPQNMGECVSHIVADDRMAFIVRHTAFRPHNVEFVTTVVQLLRQRMLFSLGLRGAFAPVAYPFLVGHENDALSPARVMERYLEGSEGETLGFLSQPVDFPAYTVDRLISLLQAAREADFVDADGRRRNPDYRGLRLTYNFIMNECLNGTEPKDPVLGPVFFDFVMSGMTEASDYFLPASDGSERNFRLTREFWLYILAKYGYILSERPGTPPPPEGGA